MPTIPDGVARRRDHRLGHRPAAQGRHQRRPRRHDGHQRRVDRRAHRHPGAPRRRHHRRPVGRRPGARRSRCPASTRPTSTCSILATTTPDQHRAGHRRRPCRTSSACAAAPSTSTPPAPASCTASSSPTASSPWAPRSPGHRHRHALPHHRLGRPQHRHPLRRRLRRRRARGGRRARASCSAGTSTPTARPSASSTPRSAATSTWTARRSSAGPCASWSTRPRRRWRTPGVTADDIALVVPHQANIRIIEAACQRLGIPMERTATVLDRTGNTSSASIPLALVDALDDGRVQEGDLVLLVGLRRRDDRGQRRAALGRRPGVSRVGPGHRRLARHRPGLRPPLRRPRRQGRRHLPHVRRRPTTCSACRATSPRPSQVDAAFEAVEEQYGPVEVLVSNAGITKDGLLAAHERGRLRRRSSTPTSPAPTASPSGPRRACCGPAGPDHLHVVGRRRCSARPARPTTPRRRPGLVGLARSLARELASRSITVNVVAPGPGRDRHDRRPRRRSAWPS